MGVWPRLWAMPDSLGTALTTWLGLRGCSTRRAGRGGQRGPGGAETAAHLQARCGAAGTGAAQAQRRAGLQPAAHDPTEDSGLARGGEWRGERLQSSAAAAKASGLCPARGEERGRSGGPGQGLGAHAAGHALADRSLAVVCAGQRRQSQQPGGCFDRRRGQQQRQGRGVGGKGGQLCRVDQ